VTSRLQGRSAIVTGAASGFGAAIAERFASEGARVMVADLNAEAGQAVAARIGGRFTRCDVASGADVQALVQHTVQAFGRLDIVVNNAGVTHANQPAIEVAEDEFDRLYRVNVKSLFHMHRAAVPAMRASPDLEGTGKGVFVNVASTTGVRPGPGLCWYSGSKGAVIATSKGLALELARERIRVCVVNPMIGETPMLHQFMGVPDTPANRERFLARIPLGRFTQPADVAAAAAYLASDDAAFITGVCLDVDGGRNI
jgi:NAD(P)-dependent dehydrogenase (short-subunit alcohol dehydrogenase family)